MGRYFERIYSNKYITVDGVTSLIDPHNMYILVLSELGLFGLLAFLILFVVLIKSFTQIVEPLLRQTAYTTLIGYLIGGAMGGSHLVNTISFAAIFWIYMGMFNALPKLHVKGIPVEKRIELHSVSE